MITMSDLTRDMIQQALDQDFNAASKTFGDIMSVKLSDVLDQEKVRLADQIYNDVEEGDPDEDQMELDLEDDEEEGVQESDPDAEESMGDEGTDGSDNEEEENDEDSEES